MSIKYIHGLRIKSFDMNNKKTIFSVVSIVMGCTIMPIDKSTIIDKSYVPAIESYIYENPNYNTFLIKESDQETFSIIKYPRGILIGPGYRNLVEGKGFSFFDIGESRVYIYSDTTIDNKKQLHSSSTEKNHWDNNNPKDSIKFVGNKNTWLYNPWENYIHRAAFVYKDNNGIHVNRKPDTIFVPKYVESSIKFEKVE